MRQFVSCLAALVLGPALLWADEPAKERTVDDIKKKLAEITAPPAKEGEGMAAERAAALRRLKAYRYLAIVPYDDLNLDDDANAMCEAGAKLCAKLGRLEHTPANPGLPEDDYQLAYKGCSRSNLGQGLRPLTRALEIWMDDSDAGNISRLGHRRWCINPSMQKTGFGRFSDYTAMYVFDRNRKEIPDYDFVSWPARGPMPVEYIKSGAAWSVSVNPKKYNTPDEDVKVKVHAADKEGKKVGEALKLNYRGVDTNAFGIPNCIIFRPERAASASGKHYIVEIEGLTTGKEKTPATLRYEVDFFSVK
jgi:hypothetical protein